MKTEPTPCTAPWAVADRQTDCTEAFGKALDEAGRAGGGVVEAPAGRYRIDGTLRAPARVTLQGVFRPGPRRRAGPHSAGRPQCGRGGADP